MTKNLILTPMSTPIPFFFEQPEDSGEPKLYCILIVRSTQPLRGPGWINKREAECMKHLWLNYRLFDNRAEVIAHSRHITLGDDDYLVGAVLAQEHEAGHMLPGDEHCPIHKRGKNVQREYDEKVTLRFNIQPHKLERWRQLISKVSQGTALKDAEIEELQECHKVMTEVLYV